MTRIKKSLKIKSAPTNIAGAFFTFPILYTIVQTLRIVDIKANQKKDIQWRVLCSFICDRLFHSHFSLLVQHG